MRHTHVNSALPSLPNRLLAHIYSRWVKVTAVASCLVERSCFFPGT